MEKSLDTEFEQIMIFTSKSIEKLLVEWILQYSESTMTITSFDILHEHIDLIYKACEKVGMNLFLPEGFLETDQSLGNLVDAIKEFWKSQKNKNIFEIGWKFFKDLVEPDFVFEEHLETYILDYKEIEFGLMVFLLVTFMMVRKRGNQSAMEESKIFLESTYGEEFIQKVMILFESLDAWEDVEVSNAEVRRGTVVGGDIGLLRQIEKMKQEIADLTEQNMEYRKKVEGVDKRLKEKDEVIEVLEREKKDVMDSKAELLKRIEGMKGEWLEEGLKEKQMVIESLEEDIQRKNEEFDEEMKDVLEQLEMKKQENQKLMLEIEKAGTGFSKIGFNVDMDEAKMLRQEKEDLEMQLNEQHKKYYDLLDKNTELEQRFRDEEFKRKTQEDEIEDLKERLNFYTKGQTGENQLGNQPIDISALNQSDFGSLLNTNLE
jgi:hypothetical protein